MKKIIGIICGFLLFFVANTAVAQTVCSNPKCHGGKIYCDDCDYTGDLNGKTCPKCNGKGVYPCPNCNGKGSTGNSDVSVSNNNTVNNSNNSNSVSNSNNASKPRQFKCPECNGEKVVPERCSNPKCNHGIIYCAECNQTGTINRICSKCEGKGTVNATSKKIDCPVCGGKKNVIVEQQEKCNHCRDGKRPTTRPTSQGDKTVYVDCSICNGKGYITKKVEQPCTKCRRGGYIIKRGSFTEECDSCKGKGHFSEKCSQCSGRGSFPCPTCKGYGNVSQSCSRCGGRGVIYTN